MPEIVNNQRCFVSTISRLRESSKDAVVSADFSDEYTKYMYVNRPVQEEFVSILEETYDSTHAELILLCGSVGDGKSHMLSYCKAAYPEKMNAFYIHNDSTASFYIDKPASYTLMEVMDGFSDEKLTTSTKKVILAINLGTLSNFLEEDRDNRFSKLKAYVDRAGIFDSRSAEDCADEYFHRVNFADYHLYELTNEGVKSDYISGIVDKIVANSPNNVYYLEYSACCKTCEMADNCPIKANYELLSDNDIKNGVIKALVEAIVKNKLMVSTRSLLNFIYEILVDERTIEKGSKEPRKEPSKMTSFDYCEALLPNMLFGRKGTSDILDSMGTVDPMRIRNENIDDFFVFYENSEDVLKIFNDDLPKFSRIISRLSSVNFADSSNHKIKIEILKLYVRICWLTGKRADLLGKDQDYIEYMTALYNWNNGKYKNLKEVYSIVERGILAWNGPAGKNEMQLPVGTKKVKYHLIQKVEIKALPDIEPTEMKNKSVCFRDELQLKFRYGSDKTAVLEIDFSLYSLLKKVIKGYIPSIIDKRVNVKCVEFIKKISSGGKKKEELTIRDLSHKNLVEYRLEFDDTFGYTFEVK